MEIVLHCGFPKTASTFLQFFFRQNKSQLEKNGIFYPTISGHAHYDCSAGDILFCDSAMCANNMNFYIEQAKIKGMERILFSNEFFPNNNFSDYTFLKNYKVSCIFFVRHFTSANESIIYENMRVPFVPKYDLNGLFTPKEMLDRILEKKSLFNNISVYSYDNAKNNNIAHFFLNTLKINNISEFNFSVNNIHARNRSLYTSEALFMRDIQLLPLSQQERYNIYFYLLKNCVTSHKKNYLFISPQKYRALAREQKNSIEELATLMDYPCYGEDSLRWLDEMEICPWERLPQNLWEEIFYNLSNAIQGAIRDNLPPHHSPYHSIELLQSPDFFPGYVMKRYCDSTYYPQSYGAAIDAAREMPFDPSCKEGPYTLKQIFWRFKSLCCFSYKKGVNDYCTMRFNKRYRSLLLTELSNKVDEEAFKIIELDDCVYDEKFLEHLLLKFIWYSHRNYIYEQAERLANREIYFWGCGEIYNALHMFFSRSIVKQIIVDEGSHAGNVDGIPVGHPDDNLPYNTNMPIVIFSKHASIICKKIKDKYSQYTDIVTCTMI